MDCDQIIAEYKKHQEIFEGISEHHSRMGGRAMNNPEYVESVNMMKELEVKYRDCLKQKENANLQRRAALGLRENQPLPKPCFVAEWVPSQYGPNLVPKCPKCGVTGGQEPRYFQHSYNCEDRGRLPCPRGGRRRNRRKTRRSKKGRRGTRRA